MGKGFQVIHPCEKQAPSGKKVFSGLFAGSSMWIVRKKRIFKIKGTLGAHRKDYPLEII